MISKPVGARFQMNACRNIIITSNSSAHRLHKDNKDTHQCVQSDGFDDDTSGKGLLRLKIRDCQTKSHYKNGGSVKGVFQCQKKDSQ